MVGHQHKSVQGYIVGVKRQRKELQEVVPVGVILKDLLSIVSSMGNMVDSPRILNAKWS